MAKETAIDRRKKKFMDLTVEEMAQKRIDDAYAKSEKSFLDAITDPASLVSLGLSAAAVAAGAPEIGALLTGADLLEAPGEMAASKEKRETGIQEAEQAGLDTKFRMINQNIQLYGQGPHAYVTAAMAGGSSNEMISRSLGLPEDTPMAWSKMVEKSEYDKEVAELVARTWTAAKESKDAKEAETLFYSALQLQFGDKISIEEKAQLARNLAGAVESFEDIVPPTLGAFTDASKRAAKQMYDTGQFTEQQILETLVPLPRPELYAIRQEEEMLEASARIAELIAENSTVINGVVTETILPSEAVAIMQQEDPRLGAIGQRYLGALGWAGSNEERLAVFLQAYSSSQKKADEQNAKHTLYPELYPKIEPHQILEEAVQTTEAAMNAAKTQGHVIGQQAILTLYNEIENLGYSPTSGEGRFLRDKALMDAEKSFGDAEPNHTELYRRAAKLLRENLAEYKRLLVIEGDNIERDVIDASNVADEIDFGDAIIKE